MELAGGRKPEPACLTTLSKYESPPRRLPEGGDPVQARFTAAQLHSLPRSVPLKASRESLPVTMRLKSELLT